MTGVNGVNPSDDKFAAIKADGKITFDEVKGLTDAEKAELAAGLNGLNLPTKEGEITYLKDFVPEQKTKNSFWDRFSFKNRYKESFNRGAWIAGIGTAVGVIGSLAVKSAGAGVAAASLGPVGWAAAAIGLAVMVVSCSGGNKLIPDPPREVNVNINMDGTKNYIVNVNEENNITIPMDKVVDAIQAMHADMNANHAEQMELLKSFAVEQLKANVSLDYICKFLKEKGAKDDEIKAILLELLGSVNEFKENTNVDMKTIIAKLEEIGGDVATLSAELTANIPELKGQLEAILNAIKAGNELTAEQVKQLNIIINAINHLGTQGQTALNELLKAIRENTEVAKNTNIVTNLILENMGKLGDKADTIIIELQKLASKGINVDLTDVTGLLQQILAQDQANGTTMAAIYNRIEKGVNKIDTIITNTANLPKAGEYSEILKQIRDKIKDHTCDHSDLIQILLELKVIIEEIKAGNNEGVLDDLDDILG